jgi:hypothetical protein
MRVIRRLAFLTLFLLLLPTFASAGERRRQEILPRLETTWIWQALTRPWILIGKAPEMETNKGRGTMDPDGAPCSEPEPESECPSDE